MRFLSGAVFLLALFVLPAAAEEISRVRAKVDSFDGKMLKVTTADGQSLTVGVLLSTVYLYDVKKSLADIKPGDFVGAAAVQYADSKLHAQEVHIFPEAMRGTGEGQYAMDASGRSMTDGVVAEVTGARVIGRSTVSPGGVTLRLDYRGADKNAEGICTGRASAPALKDAGCAGEAQIVVGSRVPVVALMAGNPNLLVPGAEVLMFVATGPDGKKVTPGLSVEKDGFKPLI